MKNFKHSARLCLAVALPLLSHAGVVGSLQHTATTLQPGQYEARGEADVILNHGGGLNVSGHFRGGLVADMFDLEGFVGTGKTDFKIGVLGQFNLLPDVPGQVALGFFSGYTFINDDYGDSKKNMSINVLTLGTIASKKLDASFGSFTPYAGFQVELLFKPGSNVYPLTGIVGSQFDFADMTPWKFYSEFNFDIHDSIFMLAIGGGYRF